MIPDTFQPTVLVGITNHPCEVDNFRSVKFVIKLYLEFIIEYNALRF